MCFIYFIEEKKHLCNPSDKKTTTTKKHEPLKHAINRGSLNLYCMCICMCVCVFVYPGKSLSTTTPKTTGGSTDSLFL